ncbi:hypothetical protein C5B85_09665 [Pseudoclavibacter sp. AY1F1]|uniref:hypothetical protein n=1 Tax=Pseudoclavibacter sp. AY1F1 TaxID=2080583 RepID=UPI000CE9234E|nr:hypothetical protein [Pseudoclavibacter sp. AY1F1]PPF44412.1 hypothetical protein C5B85_09665 [Pseudoclavibacter sp. AY1F1]
MDEIELLRRVRRDQPEPSQAAVDAGRDALLKRAAQAKTEQSPIASRGRSARVGLRWGLGTFAISGAAAAALVLAAAFQTGPPVPVVGSSSSPVSSPLLDLSGPELLETAAENIRAAGDEQLLPGQYLRVDSREIESHHVSGDPQSPSWTFDYLRTLYIPADRADEWVATRSEESVETYTEAGANELKEVRDAIEEQGGQLPSVPQYERAERGDFFGDVGNGYELLDFDWADEPGEVLDQLYEIDKHNVEPEAQAFSRVSGLVEPGYLTAEDRALLLEAAAILPAVDAAVKPVEIHGRLGIAVTLQDGGVERQIIFDPHTALPIGRQVISDTSSSFGWGINATTYTYEVVSEAPRE